MSSLNIKHINNIPNVAQKSINNNNNQSPKEKSIQNSPDANRVFKASPELKQALQMLVPLLTELLQELTQANNRHQETETKSQEKSEIKPEPDQTINPTKQPAQPAAPKEMETIEPTRDQYTTKVIDDLYSWFSQSAAELPSEIVDSLQSIIVKLGKLVDVEAVKLDMDTESQLVSVKDPTPTVSVEWDKAVQQAVIDTAPGPTIASRAYAMMHTAMYDAWSAYDETAISTQQGDDLQRPTEENTDANKREAMSYAAHSVLTDLFGKDTPIFDELMTKLGYDPDNDTTSLKTPAGIGNQMASALLELRHNDGSNQLGDHVNGKPGVPYSDITGYQPVNETGDPTSMERWTPEFVPIDSTGNAQEFLTPQWGEMTPFSLDSGDQFRPPEPEPFLLVEGTVDLKEKTITFADGTEQAIDASMVGTVINPEFIAQAEHVVDISKNLTDTQKLVAEFWEDGGGTSFPPGTFMTFGQFISVRDNHTTDQDAQCFFALGNAEMDAGIASWEAKAHYDYARPVRAIRELGELGLIGEFDPELGGHAIEAWTPDNGVQKILATDFDSYQNPAGDASPPFAEYTSGHSAFSTAGAEILKLFSGSDEFKASVTFQPGESRFENGTNPTEPITLAWDTFSDAANESGFSRLYGGIHFTDGDIEGRILGRAVGQVAWDQAQFYINGGNSVS